MSFKGFSIFSSGCHFVQWSKTILVYLVEGQPRKISVGLGGDVIFYVFNVFLFLALAAI